MSQGRNRNITSEGREDLEGGASPTAGLSMAFEYILWSPLDAQCECPEADGAVSPWQALYLLMQRPETRETRDSL